MPAAGKQTQHAAGVFRLRRLAEDLIANHDHGVGAENHIFGDRAANGSGFISRHPLGEAGRVFSRELDFVNICRTHDEVDARVLQEFLSAWGG
jgi:hypothetical protein